MGFFKSLGRFLGGTKPKTERVKRFTGAQESALGRLLSQGMTDTDVGGLEERYRHLFERDTVPGLAERFTSMGGGQRSSSFEESLRRGGLDLSEQLAGLRHQSGMQKLGFGLQPQFDTVMSPGSPGFLSKIAGPLVSMLGAGLGGPIGAAAGAFGASALGGGGQQQQAAPAVVGGGVGRGVYNPFGGGAPGGFGSAQGAVGISGLSPFSGGYAPSGQQYGAQQEGEFLPGQPKGTRRGKRISPVLLKILQGIQL